MPNELNPRSQVIASEIRAEMGRQRKSVAELAESSGIPLSTLRRSVNAERAFTLDELWEVGNSLGVRVSDLVAKASREKGQPAA